MRRSYEEIRAAGGEVVAVGTGDVRYAEAFVRDEAIPFPVLVDDDGAAADAAAVGKVSFVGMFHPRSWGRTREVRRAGHRIHRPGNRVTQLGATFVVGPGERVSYEQLAADTADHAPIGDVLSAVQRAGR